MVFLIEYRHHIAVEKEKVCLFQVTFGNKVCQHIVLAMYIVYHCKRDGFVSRIACLEHQRFSGVDIGRGTITIDNPMPDMAQHFLREDTIAIVRTRF